MPRRALFRLAARIALEPAIVHPSKPHQPRPSPVQSSTMLASHHPAGMDGRKRGSDAPSASVCPDPWTLARCSIITRRPLAPTRNRRLSIPVTLPLESCEATLPTDDSHTELSCADTDVHPAWQRPAAKGLPRLHHFFERACDARSGSLALIAGDERLTYAALDARANRLVKRRRKRRTGCCLVLAMRVPDAVAAHAAYVVLPARAEKASRLFLSEGL